MLPKSTNAEPVLSKKSDIASSGMFAIAANLAKAKAADSVLNTVATLNLDTVSINASRDSTPIPNCPPSSPTLANSVAAIGSSVANSLI